MGALCWSLEKGIGEGSADRVGREAGVETTEGGRGGGRTQEDGVEDGSGGIKGKEVMTTGLELGGIGVEATAKGNRVSLKITCRVTYRRPVSVCKHRYPL